MMAKWLTGAREMLSDERNIVRDADQYFEPVLPVRGLWDIKGDDWGRIERVCGAGAFYFVRRDTNAQVLEEAFAFKGWLPGAVVTTMTRMISRHRYGELLDLYDEAIAYWTAKEAGVAERAHEFQTVT